MSSNRTNENDDDNIEITTTSPHVHSAIFKYIVPAAYRHILSPCQSLLTAKVMYPTNSTKRSTWLTRSTQIFIEGECPHIYIYTYRK